MLKVNGDDASSVFFFIEDSGVINSMLFHLYWVCVLLNREVGKNAIPTSLILDQDPFPFLLNHEDWPKCRFSNQ